MTTKNLQKYPELFDWLASVTFLLLLIINQFVNHGEKEVLRWLGVFSFLLSIVFIFPPFFLLKKYGKVEKDKNYMHTQNILDKGIFSIVRHPQYLGYILLTSGFILTSQNLIITVIGITAIFFFYIHSLQEENFLRIKFGTEYEEYMKRVSGFNFIWEIWRYVKGNYRLK
ncbi:MAG: isoprenylcysteine carboxylmethyltransferase family protein [Calditrichia bacterium]|nr:isoprenylcysteine carboxylmethyltransferase family protein [Calditrichia bacterium]